MSGNFEISKQQIIELNREINELRGCLHEISFWAK